MPKIERMPILDETELRNNGAMLHKVRDKSFLPLINSADDNSEKKTNHHRHLIMVTGQIPRETSFEKGLPPQYKEEEGESNNNAKKLVPDPLVNDDQAIIANVKNKGLIIITGYGYVGNYKYNQLCKKDN